MFLTLEILDKYDIDDSTRAWFASTFPNGERLVNVLQHKTITIEILHSIIEHLTTTPQEKEIYYTKLKIDCADRETIYHCNDITNSRWVTRSSNVVNSEYIFNSNDVDTCNDILSSNNIQDSHKIFHSEFVYNSQDVIDSANINDSHNIVNCNYVVNSHSIINSSNVTGSAYISGFVVGRNKHIKNSRFIEECENIKHCLFCSKIADAEYMIFNKQADVEDYTMIVKQLDRLLKDWKMELVKDDVWPSQTIPLDSPVIQRNVIKQYASLPESFWRWVKTLPNYDPMVLYSITYNKDLL